MKLVQFYFFVHVLVKLGGRLWPRCRLLLYSELSVKLTSAKSICRLRVCCMEMKEEQNE